MSDTPGTPSPETPSTPPPPPPSNSGAGPSGKELDEGKLFAILSYAINIIGVPFWIAPLLMKNNEFALYHAKQAGFTWLAGFALFVVAIIIMVVLVAIFAPLACIAQIVMAAASVALLILNILGIVNAVGGKMVPLPVVGEFAANLFKGFTKKV